MSLHFVSHRWEVEDFEDGTLVRLARQDLDELNAAQLVDELFDLACDLGRAHLYLDFTGTGQLPRLVAGQLFALERRLRGIGGRLRLCNLDSCQA